MSKTQITEGSRKESHIAAVNSALDEWSKQFNLAPSVVGELSRELDILEDEATDQLADIVHENTLEANYTMYDKASAAILIILKIMALVYKAGDLKDIPDVTINSLDHSIDEERQAAEILGQEGIDVIRQWLLSVLELLLMSCPQIKSHIVQPS